jgi:hypothetical protein
MVKVIGLDTQKGNKYSLLLSQNPQVLFHSLQYSSANTTALFGYTKLLIFKIISTSFILIFATWDEINHATSH